MASDGSDKVRCKSCDRKYTWVEKYAGKKVRCKCGEAIRFPTEPPVAEVESLELELNLDSGIDLNLNDPPPTKDPAPNAGVMDLSLDLNLDEGSTGGAGGTGGTGGAGGAGAGGGGGKTSGGGDGACPNCGAQARPGAVLCVACGYHFHEGTQAQTQLDTEDEASGVSSLAGASVLGSSGSVYDGPVDGFFGRFARSWQFAKISYGMLWDFKQLLLFPIFSAIAATLVFLSFLLPMWGMGLLDIDLSSSSEPAIAVVVEENTQPQTSVQTTPEIDAAAAAIANAKSEEEILDAMEQMKIAMAKNVAAQEAVAKEKEDVQAAVVEPEPQEVSTDSGQEVLPYFFAFYFCNYFVIVFFNTALIACAMKVVVGEVPTMGYGLKIAMKRLPQILMWALLSAVVGVILKAIENSSEKLGSIIAAILGSGWTVLTYFVVPVIAVEGTGPMKSIKQSVATLKATWGESIMGNFSMGLMTFIVTLPVYLVLGVGFYVALSLGSMMLFAVMVTLTIFSLVVISAASSAADMVFKALLYNYASGKALPEGIDADMFAAAFAAPRKKGWFK